MRSFLRIFTNPVVIGSLGLLALSALIWWVGPFIGFGDWRPLADLSTRIILLAAIWLIWIGRIFWIAAKRKRTNAALLNGLAEGPSASDREAQVLMQRFNEALARLRTQGNRSRFSRLVEGSAYVYELPWYIFIGAPGSGKTTALMNAGLQFLLGEQDGQASVQGIGGTRNCDWWFTQDAVLIDTAGRYTSQESDQKTDADAWNNFLALLKRTRPRQPINGVLLTVNVQDLLQQGAQERQEHGAKLRARLSELQNKLGLRVPVYVLITKADLIGGFNESFEGLSKELRDQVWGFTFEFDSASTDDPLQDFDRLYSELGKRLAEQMPDRLEAERDLFRRAAIFAFPQEFASLKAILGEFLRSVFSGGGKVEISPLLRGVYFTSGTQEGTPIDRVMGALGRSFGIDVRRASSPGMKGRSYFLRRLLHDVVFAEQGLGIVNRRAESRRQTIRVAGLMAVLVVSTALAAGWMVSRARNIAYEQEVAARLPELKKMISGLPSNRGADVSPLPDVLTRVSTAAHSGAFELTDPPWLLGLGLYQGDKLDAGAQLAYRQILQKSLAPRVFSRIEERLRAANKLDLENAYEALKFYLMLYSPEHFDPSAIKQWIMDDWKTNYQRKLSAQQLAALELHLDALLAQGAPSPESPSNDQLIASVREMLLPFATEHLAYSRIKRQSLPSTLPEFNAARAGGPEAAQVFERISGAPLTKGVSGFYSRDGYRTIVLPAVRKIVTQLVKEEAWVRGTGAGVSSLVGTLPGSELSNRVLRLYFTDYIKTWDAYLADVQLVRLAGLERSIDVARIVSSPNSPLAAYLRGVATETSLSGGTIDKLADKAGSGAAKLASTAIAAESPLSRMVDDHFAGIHRQLEGTPAPIDETLKLFNAVYVQLTAIDAAQRSKSPAPSSSGMDQVKASAGMLPMPLGKMLGEIASAGEVQSRNATVSGLRSELQPVTEFCIRAIAGRYPFAAGAAADVPPEDFGRFFGVGGLMDSFFQKQLSSLVDTSRPNWSYKPLADGSRRATPATIQDFQRAMRIRDVFFRNGGTSPSVKLEMRALELADGLNEISLDIDGQIQKLALGAPSIIVLAPSSRTASQLRVTSNLGNAPLVFEGPWALFRLFDRFEIQPTSRPEKMIVNMNLDGRRAKLEVTASSVFNPLRLREMQQFRCPTTL